VLTGSATHQRCARTSVVSCGTMLDDAGARQLTHADRPTERRQNAKLNYAVCTTAGGLTSARASEQTDRRTDGRTDVAAAAAGGTRSHGGL